MFKKIFNNRNILLFVIILFSVLFKDQVENFVDCQEIMCSKNIKDKKSYREWMIKNHPDKGGDTNEAANVNNCAGGKNFCSPDSSTGYEFNEFKLFENPEKNTLTASLLFLILMNI
jgi:hypothetical protein